MNAKQKWVLGAVAFLLLLAIAGFGYQELQKEAERKEKNESASEAKEDSPEEKETTEYAEAPDFTVWDQEGKQTSLKEILEGKPAVINFWTSKCPPCKEEMP